MLYQAKVIAFRNPKHSRNISTRNNRTSNLNQLNMWNKVLLQIFDTGLLFSSVTRHENAGLLNNSTYANILKLHSFKCGDCELAHWNKNCKNSGHWLFPSSSIKFLASSETTSQTFFFNDSFVSVWTNFNKASFNWFWSSTLNCKTREIDCIILAEQKP